MGRDRYIFSGDELADIREVCERNRISPETVLYDRTRGSEPHAVIRALAEAFEVHYARIENILIAQGLYS